MGGSLWDFLALAKRKREKKYSLLQLNVAEFETDVLIGGRAEEGKARR